MSCRCHLTPKIFLRASKGIRAKHKDALIIYSHGDKDSLYYTNRDNSQVSLYGDKAIQLIKASGWEQGQEIVCFSCNSGAGDYSPAEYISETLNVPVTASTGYILMTNIGLSYNFGDWKTFK